MLKKPSVFFDFLGVCPSRTSLLGLPYAPRPQRRLSLPSQRGAYGKPGRLVRLGQTPKKSKNAYLFQHLGWINHCVTRLWSAKHSRTTMFFWHFRVSTRNALKPSSFLTFRLCCNYGQGCSRRRSRKGCPLREAKALTISSSAPRREHPLPLRLLLHSWP